MIEKQYEVEGIIGKRIDEKGQFQYLVKWKNYTIEDSSWQPIINLKKSKELIKAFESDNQNKKKLISLVSTAPHKQSDLDTEFQFYFEKKEPMTNPSGKFKDKNHEKEMQRLKNWGISEDQKNKGRCKKKSQLWESVDDSMVEVSCEKGIEIVKMGEKDGKTYFKVIEDGVEGWKSRNYMVEFYPNYMFDYYQHQYILKFNQRN